MNTTATSTHDPVNTLIGVLFVALIIFLVIRRKKKVKKNNSKRELVVQTVTSVPDTHHDNFGDYEKLISIAKFQKVAYKSFVVFDLETTGLSPTSDRIIEIGAVRVENGNITDTYQQLVDPRISIPVAASNVNHITKDMVKGQPTIDKILPSFLDFVGSDVLAAHNAGFDASFLDNACRKYHYNEPEQYFDTMRLSVYWPTLKSRRLDSFLKVAGIKNDHAHRALSDAEATAKLIIKSMDKIK